MKKEYLIYVALIIAGVIFASKIRSLPGGSKLPSF